jgi:hypothetical protein
MLAQSNLSKTCRNPGWAYIFITAAMMMEVSYSMKSLPIRNTGAIQPINIGVTGGEIWLVRLVPPPFGMGDLHINITTPYIIYNTNQKDWEDYFERVIPKVGKNPPIRAYNELMKYGLIPDYWNEYVFQAYANHTDIIIFLPGIPDKSEDLPHFDPDSCSCIDLSKIKTREEKKKVMKKFMKKWRK